MTILDDSINRFKEAVESTRGTLQSWSSYYQQTVDKAKLEAKDFLKKYNNLKNKKYIVDKTPALKEEYDELMEKGNFIENSIQSMLSIFNTNLNGMGAIQFIPIAAVVAIMSMIGAWIQKEYNFTKKLNLAEKIINEGGNPEFLFEGDKGVLAEGADFAENLKGLSKALIPLVLIGSVIYFAGPKIKKFIRAA